MAARKKATKKPSIKKYVVKGKTCELIVEIPTSVSKDIRKIILDATRQCLTQDVQDKVLMEIDFLINSLHNLLAEMEIDGLLTKSLDKSIREYIAANVKKGMEVGKRFSESPEQLLDLLDEDRIDFRPHLKGRSEKRRLNEYIINAMQVGEQSFETGLMLSAFLSIDQQLKILKRMEEETSVYIR